MTLFNIFLFLRFILRFRFWSGTGASSPLQDVSKKIEIIYFIFDYSDCVDVLCRAAMNYNCMIMSALLKNFLLHTPLHKIVHWYTMLMPDDYMTLEDTQAGFMLNRLSWCPPSLLNTSSSNVSSCSCNSRFSLWVSVGGKELSLQLKTKKARGMSGDGVIIVLVTNTIFFSPPKKLTSFSLFFRSLPRRDLFQNNLQKLRSGTGQ